MMRQSRSIKPLALACAALMISPAFADKKKPSNDLNPSLKVSYVNATLRAEEGDDVEMNGFQIEAAVDFNDQFGARLERFAADKGDTEYSQTSITGVYFVDNGNYSAELGLGYTTADGEASYFDYDHSGGHFHAAGTARLGKRLTFGLSYRASFSDDGDSSKGEDFAMNFAVELGKDIVISTFFSYHDLPNFRNDENDSDDCNFNLVCLIIADLDTDRPTRVVNTGFGVEVKF